MACAESLANLAENLVEYGTSMEEVALVLQWNKQDMDDIFTVEELDEKLNQWGAPSYPAVAVKGTGVFPTLKALSQLVLENLNKEYGGGAAATAKPAAAPKKPAHKPAPKPEPVAVQREAAPRKVAVTPKPSPRPASKPARTPAPKPSSRPSSKPQPAPVARASGGSRKPTPTGGSGGVMMVVIILLIVLAAGGVLTWALVFN